MRPTTSWAHRGQMLNGYYGLDVTRQLIKERQESLRRSVHHGRRTTSAHRKSRVKTGSQGLRTWLSPKGWVIHRPQPRSACA
jgi:hypothetical protein